MEYLEKSWDFKMVISRPGKVMEKNLNHKSLGKVMEMCYNHIIYAEFEIINLFFKERRSKCKPAYALDAQHFLNCSCLYRGFSLVVEIWFKVLEIHRSKCVRTLKYELYHLDWDWKRCVRRGDDLVASCGGLSLGFGSDMLTKQWLA